MLKLTNTNPKLVNLDYCAVTWNYNEWAQIRTIKISTTSSFVPSAQTSVQIISEAVDSSSVYYNGFRASNITLQTVAKPSRSCSATGDPHYTVSS